MARRITDPLPSENGYAFLPKPRLMAAILKNIHEKCGTYKTRLQTRLIRLFQLTREKSKKSLSCIDLFFGGLVIIISLAGLGYLTEESFLVGLILLTIGIPLCVAVADK